MLIGMKDFLCDLPIVCDFIEHRPKVAVIRLSGVIADNGARRASISYDRYAESIEDAFGVKDVREVALVINSPGGAPAQCSLIAGLVREMADSKKVPVTAFVEDVAASGGYWLACAADKIFVQPSSIVGSIGVIAAGFGLEDFIRKHDIKRRLYTSGKEKALLDPFSPEKKADVERIKNIQSEIHAQFIDWVKTRRGSRVKGKDSDMFEGAVWTGIQAVAHGMADGVGDVRGVLRDKYGDKVRLMEFGPEKSFVQSIMGVGFAKDAIAALHERAFWQRFGL